MALPLVSLLAGLASVAALSLFLTWLFRRSSALMPLVAVSLSIIYFMGAGIAHVLYIAGWVWFALCAAALVFVLIKEKGHLRALFSPGFVLFIVGSLAFILLFCFTQPRFSHWDEFTFWGTAAKATCTTNQLYTVAPSNLIARTYPPGLIVLCYMMQFFAPFTEYGFMAALAVLYMASFAAACAMWGKNRTASVVFMAAMALLPVLFESPIPAGNMSYSYLLCMADVPMGIFFGGALCFYFAAGDRGGRMLLPFAIILAALTCLKDMGFAFALMALAVAGLDLIFCEMESVSFFRLRRWKAWFAGMGLGLLLIVGAYLAWALHLNFDMGIDRFDLGNESQSLHMDAMLLDAVKNLFGIQRSEKFTTVLQNMMAAFFRTPVMLFGSGVVALAGIAVVLAAAWLLAPSKRRRRRVLVFMLAMCLCFAAFYVFNIFTYTYVIKGEESAILKDYHRYISPFWQGWLMASLVLLARSANNHKATYYRLRVSRAVCMVLCLCLAGGTLLRGNPRANVLAVSPSLYEEREDVQRTEARATAEGMQAGDRVYVLSQWDDASRFYLFGYEMEATRVPVYGGYKYTPEGEIQRGEAGQPIYANIAASTLGPPDKDEYAIFEIGCTPEEFIGFLLQYECSHVLLDKIDWYILEAFAFLFSDGLEGWADDGTAYGHRYYRVEWARDGSCTLVAEGGTAA